MATIHRIATICTAASLLVCGSVSIHAGDQGPDVNRLLAAARAATAKYHDVNQALADGYTDLGANPFEENELEFVNFALVNCTLDVLQPQALSYMQFGDRLRLVGVEYSIPMACAPTPPEDFLPGAGEWIAEAGAPVWSYRVPLWSGYSDASH